MRCPDCGSIVGEGACAECRALAEEILANAEALRALRNDELPKLVIEIPRRRYSYSWVAAAAAAVLLAIAAPVLRQPPERPAVTAPARTSEAMQIKMLTPDPDVVIYWLIDPHEEK
jgi:hypothetical protein